MSEFGQQSADVYDNYWWNFLGSNTTGANLRPNLAIIEILELPHNAESGSMGSGWPIKTLHSDNNCSYIN